MTPRSSRAKASTTTQAPQSAKAEAVQRDAAAADTRASPRNDPTQWQDDAATSQADRQNRIRDAAYRRFEARGWVHGRDLEDWLEAEAELASKRSSKP